MKKLFAFLILLLFINIPTKADAATLVAQPSAQLTTIEPTQNYSLDTRTKAVRNVFKKYGSPLADEAANYVKYADIYGVDWRLLPAISGLESSFGKFLMPGSFNAYGWGGGYIYFESWEDGIRVINKALRQNYMDRWGATDVWSIGPIYAESPTWSVRVNSFMNEINQEYLKLTTFSMIPNI